MAEILVGDVTQQLRALPKESIHCVVTSPPYWGLRDYGVQGQIGLEETPELFIEKLVEVFREVRRVLRKDGTLWINMGDSYASKSGTGGEAPVLRSRRSKAGQKNMGIPSGYKPKDLLGMPWRLAFALQADGWYLRSDIIWAKTNPMPESVLDRPTRAHEYIFLFSKSKRYYYDADAIREQMKYTGLTGQDPSGYKDARQFDGKYASCVSFPRPAGWAMGKDHSAKAWSTASAQGRSDKQRGHGRRHQGFIDRWDLMTKPEQQANGRNKRDVWTVATQPFAEAHFATFPEKLVEPCVLAGSPIGGVVLDPFMGSGTTAVVAKMHRRDWVGIEINPEYVKIAETRIAATEADHRLEEFAR